MSESKSYFQFERSDWEAPYSPLNRVGRYQENQLLRVFSNGLKRVDLKLCNAESILDVGCGQGAWLNTLANIRGSSEGLHGIDLTAERLDVARRMNPGIQYRAGDMRMLPYEANCFDFVTTFASLMFLPDKEDLAQALNEMSRVLRSGGYAFLMEPTKVGHTENTRGTTEKDIFEGIQGNVLELEFKLPCFRKLGAYSTASLIRKFPEWMCHLIDSLGFLPAANCLYVLKAK